MTSQDLLTLALQLATMLTAGLACGAVMRRCRQPAVVGEMIGGIILGPTVFAWLAPSFYDWLFLSSTTVTSARDAITKIGMVVFLFYAGLEVSVADLRSLGKRALIIGLVGTLLPMAAGVALVYAVPRTFWGPAVQDHFLAFALFIGMNLANSANPVIARILMDLGLLNRPVGALIMGATVVDDLINWSLFAIIVNDIATPTLSASVLPPGGGIGLAAFVAFLIGIGLGGWKTRHRAAHTTIGRVVLGTAPVFFVSMGLTTNFVTNFDALLTGAILVVACVSKVAAVLLGAAAAGMPIDREAWAVSFGLNARGATGIVLAGVGLASGVIDARIFVAIVVMALVTSLMAGPIMGRFLAPDLVPVGAEQRAGESV